MHSCTRGRRNDADQKYTARTNKKYINTDYIYPFIINFIASPNRLLTFKIAIFNRSISLHINWLNGGK